MDGTNELANRCALITGASQGFGYEVARAFVAAGAHVVLCARGVERLEQAGRELAELAAGRCRVATVVADVSRPDEMERLVAATLDKLGGLDVVVANAGIYGPKGPIEAVDWDEWRQAIDINLHGTVLTCRAVLPYLKERRKGKIIVLSGGGATKPMPFLSAYAASKAAVVRFAETLAEEVADYGIDVNTIAPGALNTRLLDEVLDAGPEKVGAAFYKASLKQKAAGGDSLGRGAELCVYLASSASDGITGKLISAKWDPWHELGANLDELRQTDIYTLRRIVPEDRKPMRRPA
jgi:NAD(P)-dependent dehydrogenase (short-subunit alcohol dehydrogenase family)